MRALVCFGVIALVACREKVPEPEASRSVLYDTAGTASAAPSGSAPEAAPTAAVKKLLKEDTKVGKGAAAKKGDSVKVHYTGTLMDGTKFDSSVDRKEPFEFTLGEGSVIRGWDEGVVGMKVGGKRELTIPSDMAYGKAGRPPTIPPNAPLKFEIELLELETSDD